MPWATRTRTDNRSLDLKLEIRRRILSSADLGPLRVWDLCAGEGVIWRELRKEFDVIAYTPVDRAPRMSGTLRGDLSPRFLRGFSVGAFNVIDIDPYGAPWEAWLTLAPLVPHRTAVFLTHGILSGHGGLEGGHQIPKIVRSVLGIPLDWKIPHKAALSTFAGPYILRSSFRLVRPLAALRCALSSANYYGLLVEPLETAAAN